MKIIKVMHTLENGVAIPHIKILWGCGEACWYKVGRGNTARGLTLKRIKAKKDIKILDNNEDED